MTSLECHSAKVLSKTVANSIVAMITDLWHHQLLMIREEHGSVCHAPLENISEMLPEIYTMKKRDFLKLTSHSLITQCSIYNE